MWEELSKAMDEPFEAGFEEGTILTDGAREGDGIAQSPWQQVIIYTWLNHYL
mgnify:FL=1